MVRGLTPEARTLSESLQLAPELGDRGLLFLRRGLSPATLRGHLHSLPSPAVPTSLQICSEVGPEAVLVGLCHGPRHVALDVLLREHDGDRALETNRRIDESRGEIMPLLRDIHNTLRELDPRVTRLEERTTPIVRG